MLNRQIFREYDIRGIAELELSDELAFAVGAALTEQLSERLGRPTSRLLIAVARDARLSGPRLLNALEAGIHARGARSARLELAPTPLLYFALHELRASDGARCDGGAIVTGSHNPPEWNGFKLNLGDESLYGEALQRLGERVAQLLSAAEGGVATGPLLPRPELSERYDLIPSYAERVARSLHFGPRRLKVVVDGGHGALGPCALALYERLPLDVVPLYCEPDGHFPAHHPDPTVEANLAALKACVEAEGADLGVAFDGDGDRVGVVDERGRVIWGDQLMIFFARELLSRCPGAKVIGEVKCSRALYEAIEEAGGAPEMWKVGHSLIKARMKESGAPLAGEMSGHIFFKDRFYGHDDGAYVAARLFELLSHTEEPLSAWLDALPQSFTTPELRLDCPDALKNELVERALKHFAARYRVSSIDGARVDFPEGWGLIRASNTQPSLVLRFEASSPEALRAQLSEVEGWLSRCAPELSIKRPLWSAP